jgi:deazaflavin-dependent oxidoreductase (nitroreductase family)
MEKISEPRQPSGFNRMLYRMPLMIYRLGLGPWMGERFIHLVHTGRKSGKLREVVLEVVEYKQEEDTYYLASGWGERSDWYRNILKTPQVEAQVGQRRFRGRAEKVTLDQAAELFSRYGRRHPRALKTLARVMGYRIDASDESYRSLGRAVPVVGVHVEEGLKP